MSTVALQKVNEQYVRSLSDSRAEPAWLRDFRVKSLKLYHELPVELSSLYTKYSDLSGVDLESTNLQPVQPTKEQVAVATTKLSTDEAITIYQIESQAIVPQLPPALEKEGVVFADIQTAINRNPDLFRRYFLEKAIMPEHDKFAALNNALFTSGFFLHVPKGIEVTLPFRHVTIFDSASSGLIEQNLIIGEARSKFTILEELYSTQMAKQANGSMHSGLSEVHLRDGAEVTYATINNLAPHVNTFENKKSIGARDSRIVWTSGLIGGAFTRSRLESVMKEPGASSENIEVVFGSGTQRFDAVSNITHLGSNTTGHAVSKGVVKERARSIFKGMIRIEKNAKNSRAYLAEHGMILGKDARADAIPGLEIETNEVKATHSASVAQINEEQIFYLMARGLTQDDAKRMIVVGFFEPVIERIPVLKIAKRIRRIIDLKWSDIYDFEASLTIPPLEDEYYEEERKTTDIFEGHYKYR